MSFATPSMCCSITVFFKELMQRTKIQKTSYHLCWLVIESICFLFPSFWDLVTVSCCLVSSISIFSLSGLLLNKSHLKTNQALSVLHPNVLLICILYTMNAVLSLSVTRPCSWWPCLDGFFLLCHRIITPGSISIITVDFVYYLSLRELQKDSQKLWRNVVLPGPLSFNPEPSFFSVLSPFIWYVRYYYMITENETGKSFFIKHSAFLCSYIVCKVHPGTEGVFKMRFRLLYVLDTRWEKEREKRTCGEKK